MVCLLDVIVPERHFSPQVTFTMLLGIRALFPWMIDGDAHGKGNRQSLCISSFAFPMPPDNKSIIPHLVLPTPSHHAVHKTHTYSKSPPPPPNPCRNLETPGISMRSW